MKNKIGWSSAFLIVFAYFLLATNIVSSEDFLYSLINLLGGIGLAWRVWQDRNYSNFALELIFISIALFKIITL